MRIEKLYGAEAPITFLGRVSMNLAQTFLDGHPTTKLPGRLTPGHHEGEGPGGITPSPASLRAQSGHAVWLAASTSLIKGYRGRS